MLSAYKDDHFEHIVLGFFAIYNFLQTFAIPGSIFLSILSGFLFPFPLACFLVSLCSALGASFCYLLRCIYELEVGSVVWSVKFGCGGGIVVRSRRLGRGVCRVVDIG